MLAFQLSAGLGVLRFGAFPVRTRVDEQANGRDFTLCVALVGLLAAAAYGTIARCRARTFLSACVRKGSVFLIGDGRVPGLVFGPARKRRGLNRAAAAASHKQRHRFVCEVPRKDRLADESRDILSAPEYTLFC